MARRTTSRSRPFWPSLSRALLYAFLNLGLFICLAFKLRFFAFVIVIVINVLILPPLLMFFESVGYSERIIKWWDEKFSIGIHKCICILCFSWICILCAFFLAPALKKEYEKN